MKNKELLFRALGEIEPEYLREAEEGDCRAVPVRRRTRVRLSVLFTAAAILILAVSAAAVSSGRFRFEAFRPEDSAGRRTIDVYRMRMGDEDGPVSLSDEAAEKLDGLKRDGDDSLLFSDWEEAGRWLEPEGGLLVCDLPTNAGAGIRLDYRDGEYRNVRSVLLHGSHKTADGFRCLIDAFVPLNEEAVSVYQGGVGYSSFLGIDVFPAAEAEEWVSEQGFETIIVSLDKSPWPGFDESIVSAHFVREGIAYRIMVRSSDPACAKEEVKNVLNSLR